MTLALRRVARGQDGFLKLVRTWPPEIYNAQACASRSQSAVAPPPAPLTGGFAQNIIAAVQDKLKNVAPPAAPAEASALPPGSSERSWVVLMEALGELYLISKNYDRALAAYLQLQRRDVFDLIKARKAPLVPPVFH